MKKDRGWLAKGFSLNPWKMSLIPTVITGLFWLTWYLVKGFLPTTQLVGKNFVLSYPRWLDIPSVYFLLPVYWLAVAKTAREEERENFLATAGWLVAACFVSLGARGAPVQELFSITIVVASFAFLIGLLSFVKKTSLLSIFIGYGLGISLQLGFRQGFGFSLVYSLFIALYPMIMLRGSQTNEEE